MSQPIRVVHWGLGAMGGGMAKLVLEKPGLRVVGAIDSDPRQAGRDLGEVLNLGRLTGVVVSPDAGAVLDGGADVAVIATGSFLEEVHPQINQAVDAGMNVICIAEEMAFPAADRPELARAMDQAAKNRGVTILGTGINPGFVLDTLIIALTGVCMEVSRIRAARINDLSPFGPTVMRTQGVGTTPEEFQRGLENGSIVGHIGFPESMRMIAAALGWRLDEIRQEREPIVSKTRRETPHVRVEPGMVAGCRHTAHGFMGGREVITLEHPQQIHPEVEGAETGDYIWIEGKPNLNLSIRPEIPGGIGTIAIAVNMIPPVVKAEPGLVSMADLPIPRALLGEIRELATESGRPGDWAQIHQVVLQPGERAPQVPDDTKRVPLELRVKGFLKEEARVGEQATVVTVTGRKVAGRLVALNPPYGHDFGRPVPELLRIGVELRSILRGEAEPGD